ncbi:MAG: MarR family winged helix-turn-helix transcriptional regulator [Rhodoblastus sp.]
MPSTMFATTFRAVNKLYRMGLVARPELDGLTIFEAMTLSLAAEQPGQTSMDLARKVGVRRDMVEKLLAKLQDLKFVELEPVVSAEADAGPALQAVTVTAEGATQSAKIVGLWEQWEKIGSRHLEVLNRAAKGSRQMANLMSGKR